MGLDLEKSWSEVLYTSAKTPLSAFAGLDFTSMVCALWGFLVLVMGPRPSVVIHILFKVNITCIEHGMSIL